MWISPLSALNTRHVYQLGFLGPNIEESRNVVGVFSSASRSGWTLTFQLSCIADSIASAWKSMYSSQCRTTDTVKTFDRNRFQWTKTHSVQIGSYSRIKFRKVPRFRHLPKRRLQNYGSTHNLVPNHVSAVRRLPLSSKVWRGRSNLLLLHGIPMWTFRLSHPIFFI